MAVKRAAPGGDLARAVASAGAGDFGAARDALIAAWRVRRAPEIAELVAVLDAKVPDATTAAIAAIVTPRAVASAANLARLAALDDPRLAAWAIDALVRLPFTATTARPFLVDVARVAARHADPRLAARAPDIAVALATRIGRLAVRQEIQRTVDRGVAALRPVAKPSAADAKHLAALAKLVEPLRAGGRSLAALLAEIYANPADDAPRLVYADALSAQGDPRGEFIVLQIARAADAAPSEREVQLLKQHGKAWLGDLAPALSWGKGYAGTEFRRGFVSKADIILSVGKKLKPILANPAWATVEEIDGIYADDDGLLVHAPLRALRTLEIGQDDWLPALAKRAEKLSAVREINLSTLYGDPPTAAILHAAFPNLARIVYATSGLALDDIATYTKMGADDVELRTDGIPHDLVARLLGKPAAAARLTLVDFRGAEEPVVLVRDARGNYAR